MTNHMINTVHNRTDLSRNRSQTGTVDKLGGSSKLSSSISYVTLVFGSTSGSLQRHSGHCY